MKPQLRYTTLAVIMLSLTAGSCPPKRVQIATPPVNLLTCAPEPNAPDLAPVDWSSVEAARPIQRGRDEAILDYVLRLRSAWGSCSASVAGVKAWVDTVE